MTWYADLSPWSVWNPPPQMLAVGWLGAGAPFARGEVEEELLTKLAELSRNGWQRVLFMGVHVCELCASPAEAQRTGGICAENIFVPGEDVFYVAPAMLPHYIRIHGYAPPPSFRRAVMTCPPPRTLAYFRTITALAPASGSSPGYWRSFFDPGLFDPTDGDLGQLDELWKEGFNVTLAAAFAHAARRDVEAALVWLGRAHRDGTLGPEDAASDGRLDPVRGDARFQALLRDMALRVPAIYEVGTLGLRSPIVGELDFSGEDAVVFHHEGDGDGTVAMPWASIFKLELQRTQREEAGQGILMIRYKEPPARYRNGGFITRSRGIRTRPWSPETLRVLEERSGRRVEIVPR